ncbi:hypothetical protein SUDANB176_07571 (plasmid) [Streptomyces sp. enrichment culture]|uniref:hypothetical protein n=1 Tax=Streptomyces sp. enrichment culture TaxID=1795815 RepID=UPI003F56F56D
MNGPPDDLRFEWVKATTAGEPDEWIRGWCNHLKPLRVRAYPTGESVTRLCPVYDAQPAVPDGPA